MKHSRLLCRLLAVTGIVFLTLCLIGAYLKAIDAIGVFTEMPFEFLLCFWFVGTFLLTLGIVGTGRQHLKRHKRLFTALVAVLVPMLTFAAMFFAITMIFASTFFTFPIRSEITQVTVVDTNPLLLSVDVKAITSRDTRIDSALVLNSYDGLVAKCCNESIIVEGVETFQPLCVLPAGSEVSLTLDFNATLPSGDYLVRLSAWHDNHGSAPFTIP